MKNEEDGMSEGFKIVADVNRLKKGSKWEKIKKKK